jgi:hypothetical protein
MNKINKLFVVVLSSLIVSMNAFAGDLTVSGAAKASYSITGGDNRSVGLGVSNELNFAASGELDNGYTWKYHTEIDSAAAGGSENDDSAIIIGMGGLGTVGICDSECGLSVETGMGIGALGVGDDFANTGAFVGNDIDISSEANVQYHTPADALPFGIAGKVAYAPNMAPTDANSYKAIGGVNPQGIQGDSAMHYQLTAAPIDGLKIGADYYKGQNTSTTPMHQKPESGGYYASYAIGNFKLGYHERYHAPALQVPVNTTAADHSYVLDGIGIEFAVNDALSVSYMEETSQKKTLGAAIAVVAAGGSPITRVTVDAESKYLQAAYDIGGATIGIANVDSTNSGYVAGADRKLTLLSLALAF